MSEPEQPSAEQEREDDVEAQLLKESVSAGLAAVAICAGSAQPASYPVPGAPGSSDIEAEQSMLPKRGEVTRSLQQAKPTATVAKATKTKKTKPKGLRGRGAGG
jgi:hypothetical protein